MPRTCTISRSALVKIHHPDVAGGDGQTMVRINLALERICEHQEEKASWRRRVSRSGRTGCAWTTPLGHGIAPRLSRVSPTRPVEIA